MYIDLQLGPRLSQSSQRVKGITIRKDFRAGGCDVQEHVRTRRPLDAGRGAGLAHDRVYAPTTGGDDGRYPRLEANAKLAPTLSRRSGRPSRMNASNLSPLSENRHRLLPTATRNVHARTSRPTESQQARQRHYRERQRESVPLALLRQMSQLELSTSF